MVTYKTDDEGNIYDANDPGRQLSPAEIAQESGRQYERAVRESDAGRAPAPAPPPTPAPKPVPEPEPPPTGAIVVDIPKDAKPVEFDWKEGAPSHVTDPQKPIAWEKEGTKYYGPGHTLYAHGFRTQDEWKAASALGLLFGPHQSDIADKYQNSRIVEIGGPKYRVTDAELAKGDLSGYVTREIEQGKYLVPITAVSEKGEKASILITEKQFKKAQDLKGEAQFDYLQSLGVYPGGWNYATTVREGKVTEFIEVPSPETDTLQEPLAKIKKYKTPGGLYDGVEIVKDKALTRDELEAVFGIGTANDLIEESDRLSEQIYDFEDNKWVWVTPEAREAREWYYRNTNNLVGDPGSGKLTPQQFEKRRAEAETWLRGFQPAYLKSGEVETDVQEYDWLAARVDKDADKHLKFLLFDDSEIERLKQTAKASARLKDYHTPEGYDIAGYLRKNGDDSSTLMAANFTKEAIVEARDYNRKYYGTGAPDYQDRKAYIAWYFKDKGWGAVPQTGLIAEGAVSSDPKIQARMDEANESYAKMFAPGLNTAEFVKRYFEDKGWDYDRAQLVKANDMQGLIEYDRRLREATDLYKKKYGTTAIVESGVGKAGYVIPAARAFNPDVKLKDISGMDWAISVAIPAMFIPGGIPLRTAINVAVGGLFAFDGVSELKKGNIAGATLNLGLTALIFAPYLGATAGSVRSLGKAYVGRALGKASIATFDAISRGVAQGLRSGRIAQLEFQGDKLIKLGESMKARGIQGAETVITKGNELIANAGNMLKRIPYVKSRSVKESIRELVNQAKRTLTAEGQAGYFATKVDYGELVYQKKLGSVSGIPTIKKTTTMTMTRGEAEASARAAGLSERQVKEVTDFARSDKELFDLIEGAKKGNRFWDDLAEIMKKEGAKPSRETEVTSRGAPREEALPGDVRALSRQLARTNSPSERKRLIDEISRRLKEYSRSLGPKPRAKSDADMVREAQVNYERIQQAVIASMAEIKAMQAKNKDIIQANINLDNAAVTLAVTSPALLADLLANKTTKATITKQLSPAIIKSIQNKDYEKARELALARIDELNRQSVTQVSKTATVAGASVKPVSGVSTKSVTSAKSETKSVIKPATTTVASIAQQQKIAQQQATKPTTLTQPRTAVQPKPEPQPRPQPTPVPTKPVKPPEKPTPKIIPPRGGGSTDKKTREILARSGGGVGWRQGRTSDGKDIWHVITHPYESNENYHTVIGRKPTGAKVIVTGPESAYKTAALFYGKKPSRRLMVDMGIQDISITPSSRGIDLKFTPDPNMETTGDITIGKGKSPFPLGGKSSRRLPR